jgi:hypothetical protein
MSEHTEPTDVVVVDESGLDTGENAPHSDPVRTGHEAVDGVLDALDGLDRTPISEHVTVYEKAHEQLRGALDA